MGYNMPGILYWRRKNEKGKWTWVRATQDEIRAYDLEQRKKEEEE